MSQTHNEELVAKKPENVADTAREDIPAPEKTRGGKPPNDMWGRLFSTHGIGTSFLVSEAIRDTMVNSSARHGVVLRSRQEKPFVFRVWIVEKK